jgi:hypothetical protein
MLHACFTPIALCFVYTLWHFYAFSGTNLLTRCRSASSCFLLFFYFKNVIQEIFSELDETKVEVPILLTRRRSPKERRRRARRRPHHRVARPHPWPHQALVWAPRPPSNITLLPINSLHRENPKARTSIHEKYYKPPLSSTWVWKVLEALPGTLSERGIITGGLLHRHAYLRSDVWVVHLGLWVHSGIQMVVFSSMRLMSRSCELPIMIKIIFM